jgi:hypothetical protein
MSELHASSDENEVHVSGHAHQRQRDSACGPHRAGLYLNPNLREVNAEVTG